MKSYQNSKTIFTRKCITEAILSLMKEKELSKITVTAVVKKAGIARMTFYLHYASLIEAMADYLQMIVDEFESSVMQNEEIGRIGEYSHIMYALTFYDQYREYFLTLTENGLHYILLNGINHYMENHYEEMGYHSVYEMYGYSGGLLNTFLKWEEQGKKESVEEVAKALHALYRKELA